MSSIAHLCLTNHTHSPTQTQTWLKHLKKHSDKEQLLVCENLQCLFQSVQDEYSYLACPTALGEVLPGRFTTDMIVAAAVAVPDRHKANVLYAFAKKAWTGNPLLITLLYSIHISPPSHSPSLTLPITPHTYVSPLINEQGKRKKTPYIRQPHQHHHHPCRRQDKHLPPSQG